MFPNICFVNIWRIYRTSGTRPVAVALEMSSITSQASDNQATSHCGLYMDNRKSTVSSLDHVTVSMKTSGELKRSPRLSRKSLKLAESSVSFTIRRPSPSAEAKQQAEQAAASRANGRPKLRSSPSLQKPGTSIPLTHSKAGWLVPAWLPTCKSGTYFSLPSSSPVEPSQERRAEDKAAAMRRSRNRATTADTMVTPSKGGTSTKAAIPSIRVTAPATAAARKCSSAPATAAQCAAHTTASSAAAIGKEPPCVPVAEAEVVAPSTPTRGIAIVSKAESAAPDGLMDPLAAEELAEAVSATKPFAPAVSEVVEGPATPCAKSARKHGASSRVAAGGEQAALAATVCNNVRTEYTLHVTEATEELGCVIGRVRHVVHALERLIQEDRQRAHS